MAATRNIVKMLTSAALAMPGLQAQAEAPPPLTRAEFGYSTYDESGVRYDINVYQSIITGPLTERTSFAITTQRDMQTGASFVFAYPQSLTYYFKGVPNVGNPSVIEPIYTQASIREIRDAVTLSGSYYFPESIATVGYRYSTEDDYISHSVNGEWQRLFNKKNTELTLGVGYSGDVVRATLDGVPGHLPRESIESNGARTNLKAVVGLRQDFSTKLTGQLSGSYAIERGYLGDPYKRVTIYGNAAAIRPGSAFIPDLPFFGGPLNIPAGLTVDYDRRPGRKETYSIGGKLIRYIETFNGALHGDYRFAYNTWDIASHTFETSYHQPFKKSWEIIPLIRYYTQTEANFYSYMFEATGGAPFPAKLLPASLENSSDNRLSKFGTFNVQAALRKEFPANISLSFVGGIYASRGWLHWGTPNEVTHPANDYTATYFSLNTSIDFA